MTGGGGDLENFSEVFWEESVSIVGSIENKRVEKLYSGFDRGVSARKKEGDSIRFGYTNRLEKKELEDLTKYIFGRSVTLASVPEMKAPSPNIPTSLMDFILELDRKIWALGDYIKQVKISFSQITKKIIISNSMGFSSEEERPYFTIMVNLVGERNGVIQTFRESYGGTFVFKGDMREEIEGRFIKAAEKLKKLLSAPPSPHGEMAVVIAGEAGGTMIHEAVGHGLEADLVYKGVSVYKNRLGEKVANSKITVVDDPTIPGMRGSYKFDDEGTRSRRNVLIEKGILKGYLSDLRHLKKVKGALPGNGRRESYRHPPIPRMSNTFIEKGSDDPGEIIKSVDKGIYVVRMGGGQVNTVNGDFVFEVMEGYLIEKGSVGEMVRGATLLGNGPKVLEEIDMVGDDLGFSIGTCGKDGQGVPISDGQPTLRIPRILVGGKGG